ncbi:hypothetical protein [Amycolatopsis orientalis]|uniref:hypothetical protein n=1 Tax=Amycolatopsis orientalis TaxID=31958 RepID=UPI0003A89CB9|nr:hypothetical protein [Amycolatopsis orientalis]
MTEVLFESGFAVVLCDQEGCLPPPGQHDVLAALRTVVSTARYGVLIRSGCLFRSLRAGEAPCSRDCGGNSGGPGAYALVQRCDSELRPLGPAAVAGPLHEPDDTAALCEWLETGVREGKPLPARLRPVTVGGTG